MPAIVRKRGRQWVVLSHKGSGARVLGKHGSRERALRQARAVNVRLSRRRKR